MWARGTCTFQCKICKYTTGGSVDFWKHVKNTHDFEIPVYKETYGNPCIVMNKITCTGCSSILRYDYGTLLGHASTRHKMNLMEFYNKFFKSSVEKVEETPENVKIPVKDLSHEQIQEAQNNNVSNESSIKLVPKLKFGTSLSKRAHMWGWRCRYKVCMVICYISESMQLQILMFIVQFFLKIINQSNCYH